MLLRMCDTTADEVVIVAAATPQPSTLGVKGQTRQDEDVQWCCCLEHCALGARGISTAVGLDRP
jgi:hypothetical protein